MVARLGLQLADQEDAVQEAFARVSVEWAGFVSPEELPAHTARRRWIADILVQLARRLRGKADRIRARVPYRLERAVHVIGAPSHEGPIAARELLRGLEGETTAVRWRIWVSHEVNGVTAAEIARQEGLPVTTIYNHLRLARRDLGAALGRDAATGTGPLVRRGWADDKKPRH